MRWVRRGLGLGLLLSTVWGCGSSSFQCLTDAGCQGLDNGRCEATGFCSHADADCESGRRYSTHAGMLAGACVVPADASTGGQMTAGPTGAEGGGATTSGSSQGSSTAAASTTSPTTTGVAEPTSSSTDATTGSSDGRGDSSTTGPPVRSYDFEDDFERPNNDVVGNGWQEKTEAAFGIANGTLRRDAAETSFPDNLVYRPGLVLEGVEVHTTFRFLGEAADGFPQVHVRIDEATSADPGPSTGYVLYLPNGVLDLIRVDDGTFTEFAEVTPDAPIVTGVDYRFRLLVSAGSPAQLDAYLDQQDGEGWTQIAELHHSDPDPLPAGTLGLSGHATPFAYAYEHIGWFER